MKSWIILIVLAVALTAAFTVALPMLSSDSSNKDLAYPAPAKRDGPMPVAEVVEGLVYNFGALPQHYNGQHTWTFKNSGAGPLELRGVGETCSCTAASAFGKKHEIEHVIPPGETLPIVVDFDTKEWNKDKWAQSVTIGTNDPAHPTFVLLIEGTVKPAITTVPGDSSISFGIIGNEEEASRKVGFYSIDRPDVKLLSLKSSNPELLGVSSHPLSDEEAKMINSTRDPSSIKITKGHIVEVTLKPSSNLGSFAEEILVETDHPQKAELRFKVSGKITGPISTIPERVLIRGATTSDGGTELVKISARNRASVNFTVASKPKDLDVSITVAPPIAGSKGSRYNMMVKLVPGAEPGRIRDEIVLKTDDPKASELKIPVDVLVQGSK